MIIRALQICATSAAAGGTSPVTPNTAEGFGPRRISPTGNHFARARARSNERSNARQTAVVASPELAGIGAGVEASGGAASVEDGNGEAARY